MTFNEYQEKAKTTAVYGPINGISSAYPAFKMACEVFELCEQMLKAHRDNGSDYTARRPQLVSEAGDVLWYGAAVATELSVPLSRVTETDDVEQYEKKLRDTEDVRTPFHIACELGSWAGYLPMELETAYGSDPINLDRSFLVSHVRRVLQELGLLLVALELPLDEVMRQNLEKLAYRSANNTIHGDNRTEEHT